ncbi:MAG: hypothetical protein R3F56_08530 [Planctomycetota bacterium]
MRICLTRLSNDRHRLAVTRAGGACIERDLETRSVLLHDLVHYAVEAEAGIDDGFWGLLAAGADFDDLVREASAPSRRGIVLVEALVGPMQAVWNGRLDADHYVALARRQAPFVDRAFVDRVLQRLRRLWGHWRGTPFHRTMELVWPPADPTAPPASG